MRRIQQRQQQRRHSRSFLPLLLAVRDCHGPQKVATRSQTQRERQGGRVRSQARQRKRRIRRELKCGRTVNCGRCGGNTRRTKMSEGTAARLVSRLVRAIRTRVVLAAIFSGSLTYFLIKTGLVYVRFESDSPLGMQKLLGTSRPLRYDSSETIELDSFRRRLLSSDNNGLNADAQHRTTRSPVVGDGGVLLCRNTRQGRDMITDDRGYTCARDHRVTLTGCCPISSAARYTCAHCLSHCCQQYEHCVSCCMKPANAS